MQKFPQDKIQILIVEDLFNDKKPQPLFGSGNTTFKQTALQSKSVSKALID